MNIIEKLRIAIQLEKAYEIQNFEKILAEKSLAERVQNGISFYPIQWKEEKIGTSNQIILEFESDAFQKPHSKLQNGQVVSVFTLQELPKKIPKSFKGVVYSIFKDTIQIIPYHSDLPDWLENGKLGLDLYFDETSYNLMEKALEKLEQEGNIFLENFKKICFGKEKLNFTPLYDIKLENLNERQKEAVKKIISAKELAIIHGPPGTGKTTTLTEAIYLLCKNNQKILVCAASNTATDLLAYKLHQKGLKVVRLGHPARMEESLWNLTLDSLCKNELYYPQIQELRKRALILKKQALKYKRNFNEQDKITRKESLQEVRELQKEAYEIEKNLIQKILQESDVIGCTLTGSENEYLENRLFDVLVIDEAAQALEPACWIAIHKAKKIILAGDHFQLPPTVKCPEAEKMGLSITLFERLIAQYPEASVMLNTQYRANELIMQFSSQKFYQQELHADESVKNQGLSEQEPIITYIDTAGCGFQEIQNPETLSYYNPHEIKILFLYLEDLLKRFPTATVGIISPYKEQVKLLEEAINTKNFINSIKIDTVDGFQGEERDIIALSMVRSNENGEIGFLKDIRRMNVAITRARKKLVIIGDSSTLAHDKFYEEFLNYLSLHAEYKTAWEFL